MCASNVALTPAVAVPDLTKYSRGVPVHVISHPVAQDTLLHLRDARTDSAGFRLAAQRLSLLVAIEATRDLPTAATTVHTPLGPAHGQEIDADVVVVPVLRAGLGMLDAVLGVVPRARVGYIGLQRDESTAVASQYYAKFPVGLDRSYVLLVDPMLATGGSAVAALHLLAARGARAVRLLCIVAAPEGIGEVQAHFPDVHIYTPVIDEALNQHKFIVPGLGDFGDRLYGTA
ncbi:MAG: uracil phosphoribosyltransferase [Acidobacteria bacterium]|nr:uracil phosphoribosyltransferase [Acidobacteriota bacterium]